MTDGITTCPDCGAGLGATDYEEQLPTKAARMTCQEECGFEAIIALVEYPDGRTQAVASALDDDVCSDTECEAPARWRIDADHAPVRTPCPSHASLTRLWKASYDEAQSLLG